MITPALETVNLSKSYRIQTGFRTEETIFALQEVSFKVDPGKTLGIVGESGCGKSTLAKTLMGIVQPDAGEIFVEGKSFRSIPAVQYRQTLQMIFQDPYRSLNPRRRAIDIVAEPLYINSTEPKSVSRDRAIEMMGKVGLRPSFAYRYPHMFSGGQRQRLGIARALIMKPKIVVCDEPVSALDVSIQAQVLNLLMDLQDEFNLTYLFISHDLSVVEHLVDQVAVMYLGRVVEYGSREKIFSDPKHPYTQALLASTPQLTLKNNQTKVTLKGELPSAIQIPKGCSFHSRCGFAKDICQNYRPILENRQHRWVACHVVSD